LFPSLTVVGYLRVRWPEGPRIVDRVNITVGPLNFDHADYNADNDVLHLHVGEPEQPTALIEGDSAAEPVRGK
jgi:hypothetical protein